MTNFVNWLHLVQTVYYIFQAWQMITVVVVIVYLITIMLLMAFIHVCVCASVKAAFYAKVKPVFQMRSITDESSLVINELSESKCARKIIYFDPRR